MSEGHPALDALLAVQKRYPNVWTLADDLIMRFTFGKHREGCIFSDAEGYALSMRLQGDVPNPTFHPALFGALVSWRPTKGIYRFHPALCEALIDSDIEGEIPSSLLQRMPGHAVYIEMPTLDVSKHMPIKGFFAYLSRLAKQDTLQLVVLLRNTELTAEFYPDGFNPFSSILLFSLPLGNHPVSDLLQMSFDNYDKMQAEAQQATKHTVSGILSLLLYLCSEQPDIENWKSPEVKSMFLGSKRRLIAAKEGKTWDVGLRIGASLDFAVRDRDACEGTSGITVRPHIRRAHWHSFWLGKRGAQSLSLRWLPPIAVKTKEPETLPAVIHAVDARDIVGKPT